MAHDYASPVEVAHVLFLDIVGYSKLSMELQRKLLKQLQETVRATPDFCRARSANKLISLPTGDGMALVFFGDPEAPCRCALEIGHRTRNEPHLQLRMGIHMGPVYQ